MIKAIFLDMDDTLIVNQVLFDRAEAQLYDYLQNFGIAPAEAKRVLDEKDKELFKIYGRSPQRPPATFEAVLKHFVPDADEEMVSIVRAQGRSIFTAPAALKPGVAEAIDILAKHYQVYIVTAGGVNVQKSRMAHLPFMNKLSGVMIVPQKDANTYKTATRKWNLNPAETVMVGDSLASDIVPALAAGLEAVWIDAKITARHETIKTLPQKKGAHQFSSLLEMAQTLEKTGTLNAASAPKISTQRNAPKAPKIPGP